MIKFKLYIPFLFLSVLVSCKENSPQSTNSEKTTDPVQVVGGTFMMGSNDVRDYNASPPHSITLSSFFIDKYEVTYEKWTEVYDWGMTHGYTDMSTGQNGYNPSSINNPVTKVNWYDALKWCNARSEKDGLMPVYYTDKTQVNVYRTGQSNGVKWNANGYRLPTEAEWEFAARGGTNSRSYIYSGSNTLDNVAWNISNSDTSTHTVGTKSANELGIYDMSGNVWEWCWDWSDAYSSNTQTDPKGPTSGSFRVRRGGGSIISYGAIDFYRVAGRGGGAKPSYSSNEQGFRCVKN